MSKNLFSYLLIGIACASGTFILSNLLIFGYSRLGGTTSSLVLATCFFVASITMILPSFWLNRKTTFGDKNRKSGKLITLTKAYSIYIISPMVASLVTFLLQNTFNFEAKDISITWLGLSNYDFNYGRYSLQILAIGVSAVGNYLGQKLWIYN
ncbi:MAG: GtrA family protein [Candidatus Parcubacteria bacterium]|nr:GtrA family protein [Candidatus Paceibacterota bacterium]